MTMLQRFWRWLTLADARDDMAAVWAEVAVARLEAEAVNANLEMLIGAVTDAGQMDVESTRKFREYLGRPEVQAELDEIIAATDKPLAPIR